MAHSERATTPQAPPLLTVSVPIGLQYGGNSGRIQVQGNGQGTRITTNLIDTTVGLRVEPNPTLALVGGDIALAGGTLKTAGGRIELGSVASPGLVSLTPINSGWALGYEGVPTFGDIQLSQQATVDASGAGSGDIQVQGRQVTLTNGSSIQASTLGAEPGGTLSVTASDAIELIGTSADGQFASGLSTQTLGEGDAGDITIATGQLLVKGGAQLLTNTFGTGAGGTLSVTASDAIELIGTSADGRFASGLSTQTLGDDAGDLTIATGRLLVKGGAQINASTFGTGAGGTLSVTATDAIEVIGESANGQSNTGLFAQTRGEGDAGDLTIATGRLNVRDGSQISVRSIGLGNAGSLEVTADSIRLDNQAFLSSDTPAGQGNIFLRSRDLVLRRGSNITTNATGPATGGNITIDTDILAALENSDISANAQSAFGGQVRVNASGIFGTEFRETETPESDITASSRLGSQFSGTVEINTPDVDPSQGLVALPVELVDAPGLIATGCSALGENEFIITGRGGLPPSPDDPFRAEAVLADWVPLPLRTQGAGEAQRAGGVEGAEGEVYTDNLSQHSPPASRHFAQRTEPPHASGSPASRHFAQRTEPPHASGSPAPLCFPSSNRGSTRVGD